MSGEGHAWAFTLGEIAATAMSKKEEYSLDALEDDREKNSGDAGSEDSSNADDKDDDSTSVKEEGKVKAEILTPVMSKVPRGKVALSDETPPQGHSFLQLHSCQFRVA